MSAAPIPSEPNLWELFDMSPMFSAGLECFLDTSLRRCVEWFRASGGSIFLADAASPIFRVKARCGRQDSLPSDTAFRLGEGIAGIVAQSGLARVVDDPSDDPELAGRIGASRGGISSAMVIPLVGPAGTALGVLNISRAKGEPVFVQGDLLQAETLAAHLAMAVSNAQMVHELHLQMEESRLATEKLMTVLDSVAGAVVVVDKDGEIVNHNEAAARQSFIEEQNPKGREAIGQALRSVIQEAASNQVPISTRADDLEADRSWLIEAVPLASGGAVITVRETTLLERQQRELARVKRLAEIGQMTAAIAHEIRNPLTGIRSAAQMMASHPDMSDVCRDMIDEEVMKLNDLCEDFLDFARPLHLSLKPVSLPDLVRRVAVLMRLEFGEKGVILECEAALDQPTIELDARRVEQVAFNLIRNSLQASSPGSVVRVCAEAASFWVEDRGVGMSEDEMSRLFSPFFTTKSNGTGLGLCNVQKIVDAHGGTIRVQSQKGIGSRFEVDFESKAE